MKGSVWAAFTGLALLAAMRAEAQQAPDPIAAAGLLQGQCQAIDPSVAVSCGKLSGAVANGHDPSAGLPATDTIQPGDLHVFGPWAHAIVLRKDAAGWSAFAVTGSATGADIVVSQVADAAQAQALMAGKGIEAAGTAATDTFGEGWITEVRDQVEADAAKVTDDLIARYISPGGANLDIGAFVRAMPVRWSYPYVSYVHDGLFRADQAGAYRFAVTFQPNHNEFTDKWDCEPRLAFVQGKDKVPVLPAETVEVELDARTDSIKSLVSSTVNMPAGFNAMEITAGCTPETFGNPPHLGWAALGTSIRTTAAGGNSANPWPVLVLSVQRPGESGFSPVRPSEILYPKDAAGAALPLGQAQPPSTTDNLKELSLPPSYKPGWFVDVFPVIGDDTAWTVPPSAPRQGTFIGSPGGFAMNEHILRGLMTNGAPDHAGKIFVATLLFLAPKAGHYTFVIEPENPQIEQLKKEEDCIVELKGTTPKGEPIPIIDGSKVNLFFLDGVVHPASGGVELGKGAYRISLRVSCAISGLADISQNGYGLTRMQLYLLRPGEQLLSPARDGDFVYKTAQ